MLWNRESGSITRIGEEHQNMFEIAYGFQLARRALVLAVTFAAGCCAVWAQTEAPASPSAGGPPPGEHWRGPGVERELHHLTEILSLTAEQQTQVKALLVAQRQQLEALRAATPANSAETGPTPAAREQMQTIHQTTDEKISALLNDEQKTKFAAWQQQRKEMMQRRRGPGAPDGVPPADAPSN
jgi:Spy/CpxP family protein refolding chaperone